MIKIKRYPGLYRLPDGRFFIRATAKSQRTNKMRQTRKTLAKGATLEEAVTELQRLKTKLREDAQPTSPQKRMCVNDYAEQWTEQKARRVRPHVIDRYTQVLGMHILPKVGDLYVDTISRNDVIDWVADVEVKRMADGRPFARDTVMGFWFVLKAFLQDMAATHGQPDPTYRVAPPKPPEIQRRELRTLSGPQLGALLDSLEQFCPGRYAEGYVMALTGIRAGEAYALCCSDLDESRLVLNVSRSVWRGEVSGTKTDTPREVAVSAELVKVLSDHRERLVAAQHRGLSTGLIFPANNGSYRNPQSMHKPLSLAAEAAGIDVKVTPQVLRRTFNTLMLAAGVDRIVLRSQMGHSSEEMTQRYAGIPIEAKHDALAKVMKLVEAA